MHQNQPVIVCLFLLFKRIIMVKINSDFNLTKVILKLVALHGEEDK